MYSPLNDTNFFHFTSLSSSDLIRVLLLQRNINQRTNMKPLALLTLLLIMSGSAVGQTLKSNVTGFVGKDVLLSFNCSSGPKELIWQKGERVVNAHSEDKIIIDDSYVDRTQLFINEEKRNCSLLLRNISTADAGLYTCHAIDSVDNNVWSKESTEVNLTVESNPERGGQTEEKPVTAVSVSVTIAVVVLILAVILLLILLIRRQHRTNTNTDLPAEKPMLQNV